MILGGLAFMKRLSLTILPILLLSSCGPTPITLDEAKIRLNDIVSTLEAGQILTPDAFTIEFSMSTKDAVDGNSTMRNITSYDANAYFFYAETYNYDDASETNITMKSWMYVEGTSVYMLEERTSKENLTRHFDNEDLAKAYFDENMSRVLEESMYNPIILTNNVLNSLDSVFTTIESGNPAIEMSYSFGSDKDGQLHVAYEEKNEELINRMNVKIDDYILRSVEMVMEDYDSEGLTVHANVSLNANVHKPNVNEFLIAPTN